MKLRYILTSLVAAIAVLSSCEKQEIKTQLDEIQVSSSYVAIPMDGGSTQILLTATSKRFSYFIFMRTVFTRLSKKCS